MCKPHWEGSHQKNPQESKMSRNLFIFFCIILVPCACASKKNIIEPIFAVFSKTPKSAHGGRQIRVNTWIGSYVEISSHESLQLVVVGTGE